jgi:hypothetical protein
MISVQVDFSAPGFSNRCLKRASISGSITSTEYCGLNEFVVLTMLTTVLGDNAKISGLLEFCDANEFVVLTTLTVGTFDAILEELWRWYWFVLYRGDTMWKMKCIL